MLQPMAWLGEVKTKDPGRSRCGGHLSRARPLRPRHSVTETIQTPMFARHGDLQSRGMDCSTELGSLGRQVSSASNAGPEDHQEPPIGLAVRAVSAARALSEVEVERFIDRTSQLIKFAGVPDDQGLG